MKVTLDWLFAVDRFNYNPETGALTWAVNDGHARIGDPAGTIGKHARERQRLAIKELHGEFARLTEEV